MYFATLLFKRVLMFVISSCTHLRISVSLHLNLYFYWFVILESDFYCINFSLPVPTIHTVHVECLTSGFPQQLLYHTPNRVHACLYNNDSPGVAVEEVPALRHEDGRSWEGRGVGSQWPRRDRGRRVRPR